MAMVQDGTGRTSATKVSDITARIVLTLFATNTLFNLVARAFGLHWPYSTFLFAPTDLFGDFFKAALGFPGGDMVRPSHFLGLHDRIARAAAFRPYPGIAALAAEPLNPLQMMPLTMTYYLLEVRAMRLLDPAAVFLGSALAVIAGYVCVVLRGARSRHLAERWLRLGLLSYPMLMVLTRGNLQAGVTALLIVQAMLCAAERKRPVTTAVLLAIAVNIRPNAILFGLPMLLLFADARWRVFAATGVAGVLTLAASAAAAHALFPDYTISSFGSGLRVYYQVYVIDDLGLWYGSSLFGGLKLMFGYHAGMDTGATVAALALLVAGLATFWRGRLTITAMVFVTACAYCLATPVIADYHLLCFVAVPMLAAREPRIGRIEWIAVIAASLLLSPKNYIFFGEYSLQIVLNPAIMLAASIAVVTSGWRPLSAASPDGGYSAAAPAS